jgi:hypothetical protein
MRSLLVLLIGGAALIAAPAPLPRPAVVESIVVAPEGDPERAAEQIRSLELIEKAFVNALSPGVYRGATPAWVRERLHVEVIRDGSALRITLSDCECENALALLRTVVQQHLYERVLLRKEITDSLIERLGVHMKYLREEMEPETYLAEVAAKGRDMLSARLRRLTSEEEDAIVLLQPCRVRGR